MIGFGDILFPGLLVAFSYRYCFSWHLILFEKTGYYSVCYGDILFTRLLLIESSHSFYSYVNLGEKYTRLKQLRPSIQMCTCMCRCMFMLFIHMGRKYFMSSHWQSKYWNMSLHLYGYEIWVWQVKLVSKRKIKKWEGEATQRWKPHLHLTSKF